PMQQNPGVLTVSMAPDPLSVQSLTLTSAKVPMLNVSIVGDVAPDGRSMLAEVDLDPLAGAMDYSFSMLPQGVYSVVSFTLGAVIFEGTWRGMPLHIHTESDDHPQPTQLRAPASAEI